jgi:hypothetical protein
MEEIEDEIWEVLHSMAYVGDLLTKSLQAS